MDEFDLFRKRHHSQMKLYTLFTPENISMQDRRNFIPECIGCVNRQLKFKYYPLQKFKRDEINWCENENF